MIKNFFKKPLIKKLLKREKWAGFQHLCWQPFLQLYLDLFL